MALAIKAIPTLYGDEARRFREMADETERKFDMRPKRDLTADPRYKQSASLICALSETLQQILAIRQCAQFSRGRTLTSKQRWRFSKKTVYSTY